MLDLDGQRGEALKERGQQLAMDFSGDWADEVMGELRDWLAVQKEKGLRAVTIEQFRAQAKAQPKSHKCWGSLPRLAIKAGLLKPHFDAAGSPVYRLAAAPKTHAHPVKSWEIA